MSELQLLIANADSKEPYSFKLSTQMGNFTYVILTSNSLINRNLYTHTVLETYDEREYLINLQMRTV